MERRINEEFVPVPAEVAEADAFGVAKQPGRLVIAGPSIAVECCDPEGGLEGMALRAWGPTGRRRVHAVNLISCATPVFRIGLLCL